MIERVMPIPARIILAWPATGGKLGMAFTSKTKAARVLRMTGSQVNDVCRGRRRHAHGWVFKEVTWRGPYGAA